MRVAALFVAISLPIAMASAQSNSSAPQTTHLMAEQPAQSEIAPFTFHATTREVVLDLIALTERGGPVLDLTSSELQVSYGDDGKKAGKHHHKSLGQQQIAAPVTSLVTVDPNAQISPGADAHSGFQIVASCLERSTLHYQLTFRPGADGWTSGFHDVSVTTTRPGIRLFYRRRYFVGETVAPAKPPVPDAPSIAKLLRKDACYYPSTPLSLSLHARLIDSGSSDMLHYEVAVDAASLSYLRIEPDAGERELASVDRRVQVDFGICAFNAAGHPIGFFHAPLDQVLTSADYAHAVVRGFPHVLQLQANPSFALVRIVVRDRATGNLGATDVPTSTDAPPAGSAESVAAALAQEQLTAETARDFELFPRFTRREYIPPPHGPIGSFGSVVPASNSFCGDVFELEQPSRLLPEFREIDPIGSIYTYALDVPSQVFTNTSGIPGVTPRTNLFGIDYHSVFWVQVPGDYQFRMVSDDGAMLWIDDDKLIDLDGLHVAAGGEATIHLDSGSHSMHIPYYQGAVMSVALILWVRSPGEEDWKIFDLRNFTPPDSNAE